MARFKKLSPPSGLVQSAPNVNTIPRKQCRLKVIKNSVIADFVWILLAIKVELRDAPPLLSPIELNGAGNVMGAN